MEIVLVGTVLDMPIPLVILANELLVGYLFSKETLRIEVDCETVLELDSGTISEAVIEHAFEFETLIPISEASTFTINLNPQAFSLSTLILVCVCARARVCCS